MSDTKTPEEEAVIRAAVAMASAHAEENFKLYMLRKGPRQKIQSVLDAVTSMQQARRAREEGE